MRFLVPIVEGHGEVDAVPALLHRIAAAHAPTSKLRVNPPIRIKVGSFLNDPAYFHRYVSLASAKASQECGSVLVMLDCEDECPGTLGPAILERARAVRSDIDVMVALAHREYETWFLAAAASLRDRLGLAADIEPPDAPESIRDAKGWLSRRMSNPYDPVMHQVMLTRAFDMDAAMTVPSFARLRRRISELVAGRPRLATQT